MQEFWRSKARLQNSTRNSIIFISQLKKNTFPNKKRQAFTVLELIIAIIIISILLALSLPRFFSVLERARSVEALVMFDVLRNSMARCYLKEASYTNCGMSALDYDGMTLDPDSFFNYQVDNGDQFFVLRAFRNSKSFSGPASKIEFRYETTGVIKFGTGVYNYF